MIRLLVVLVIAAVGFTAYAVRNSLVAPVRHEKIVYCPVGTSDPECVHARRLYDTGKITTPSGAP
jgi:hypothetical protein